MSKDINLGSYLVPKSLDLLIRFYKELEEEKIEGYGDYLGFFINLEESRYGNTPLDVVTFGSTGIDGDHFGFLTDFSTVQDLEEAYIVSVTPMDFENPVNIVARNFRDFLSLYVSLKEITILNDFFLYTSEKDFIKDYTERFNSENSFREDSDYISEKLIKYFNLPKIDNVYRYIESLKKEREELIMVPTQDRLGVLSLSGKPPNKVEGIDYDVDNISEIFETVSIEEKLGLVRDFQFNHGINDELEACEYLDQQLNLLGFPNEANRLRNCIKFYHEK